MSESQDVTKAEQKPARVGDVRPESLWQPFAALRSEMDPLFVSFLSGIGTGGGARRAEAEPQPLWRSESCFGPAVPAIDVVEAEGEFRIKAESPDMDASAVELALSDDVLTIKGEKKHEREEETENYHFAERRFGSFRRSFQLPRGVDRARIAAGFDKGVRTVTLPKTTEAAAQQRKIDIRSGP